MFEVLYRSVATGGVGRGKVRSEWNHEWATRLLLWPGGDLEV